MPSVTRNNWTLRRIAARLLDAIHLKQPIKSFAAQLYRHGIPKVTPAIVRAIDHDPEAFTQGLVCHEGRLYESTGLEGRSSLRCLDIETGEILKLVPLEQGWGEGIAVMDKQIVQLTWKSGRAHIYALEDLTMDGEFAYDGEGWGLAAASGSYVMSNGSNNLSFRDRDFTLQRTLPVKLRGQPMELLNDLEYVDGRIYANVLHDPNIYEISAQSGQVTKIVDCTALVALGKVAGANPILNGIAYNAREDTYFLTGKNWSKLFEVGIPD